MLVLANRVKETGSRFVMLTKRLVLLVNPTSRQKYEDKTGELRPRTIKEINEKSTKKMKRSKGLLTGQETGGV